MTAKPPDHETLGWLAQSEKHLIAAVKYMMQHNGDCPALDDLTTGLAYLHDARCRLGDCAELPEELR